MELSDRITRIKPSATAVMAAKAREKKKLGLDVISFATGEPDYNTPSEAVAAAVEAMKTGQTHYTPTNGIEPLLQAAAKYYDDHFGVKYDALKEIIVGTGAKQLLYQAMGALIDPGDEVIVFPPAWVSYVEQIRLFDGKAVEVPTMSTNFIPDIDKLEQAITPKTVAMIINSPNNPTGVVYSEEVLKKLAELAIRKHIMLINDEVYERLVFSRDKSPQVLAVCPEARDWVLNINGVSKAFAMTGWRIGYALGPAKLIKAMSSMQGHLTSGTSSISQWAAVGALTGSQAKCEEMREGFRKRRALVMDCLSKIKGIKFIEPQGAFYVFVDISACLEAKAKTGLKDDVAFCQELLEKKNVSMVPGTAFLAPGYVRISYSCSEKEIIEGVRRFGEFIGELGI